MPSMKSLVTSLAVLQKCDFNDASRVSIESSLSSLWEGIFVVVKQMDTGKCGFVREVRDRVMR